jgi:hypothetical protein
MKKIFNFVKNNVFLILAAFWFVDFVIGLIIFSPSTLDATTRKIKFLELGSDLLWSLVFIIQHGVVKVHEVLSKRIDLVNKRVDLILDAINEAAKSVSEEKKEEADEKEVN